MFPRVYYEDFEVCGAWSVLKMVVEACSKGILALCAGHGKSPCFSRCSVLTAVSVDERGVVLIVVDGGFFLD